MNAAARERWRVLGVCAVLVVGSWVLCASQYATNGGGAYNGQLFAKLIALAAGLSIAAVALLARAWGSGRHATAAVLASVLAAATTLLLTAAIDGRG